MTTTGTVLDEIIVGVREDLAPRRAAVPDAEIERRARAEAPALDARASLVGDGTTMGLISEVKRSTPSKGALADIPEPAELAATYASAGASAISVLDRATSVRRLTRRPRRSARSGRHPRAAQGLHGRRYQFYEARAHGADIVLLIVAAAR